MIAGEIYGLHLGDFQFRYVGKTVNGAEARFKGHLRAAKAGSQYAVHNWIRKHGAENIKYCVLAHVEEGQLEWLDEREIFHIAQERTNGDLLNMTDGGDGAPGYRHTEDAKARISQAARNMSPETIAKLAEAARNYTPEHRARISEVNTGNQYGKGYKHTDEAKMRISAARKGKPQKSGHTRFHTNRSIVRLGCVYCEQDTINEAA